MAKRKTATPVASEKTNWDALKRAFITDPSQPSVATFAASQNVNVTTLRSRASREKWLELQAEYWQKVATKTEEKLSDLQSTHIALDTAQRLREIRQMQLEALKWATPSDNGMPVIYDAKDAVAAYEKLVKLERLLTEQSTENLSVSDGRQMVVEILRVIREEVGDVGTLQRIATKLAGLGGIAQGATAPSNLN